jgi:hypothetical protein
MLDTPNAVLQKKNVEWPQVAQADDDPEEDEIQASLQLL